MTVLALETSCDETSAAIVQDGVVLSNIVASQVLLHAEYGGVVPELATRAHLQQMLPVMRCALDQAGVRREGIDVFAGTRGPGLPSALLVGLKVAQVLAFTRQKTFVGVHHHEAHLYSPWIEGDPPAARFNLFRPNISLIVSGGHTILAHVANVFEHKILGTTVDDAAGECFDKVGKLLGLNYPAGPEIDRMSRDGNPHRFAFPRPLLNDGGFDFSFAGLKTAVRYFVEKNRSILEDKQSVCDICASVQEAIVDVLVQKTIRAARQTGTSCVTVSGGVTCNSRLRQKFADATRQNGFELRMAPPQFCTDNAGMIGVIAGEKIARGFPGDALDAEIRPGWELDND